MHVDLLGDVFLCRDQDEDLEMATPRDVGRIRNIPIHVAYFNHENSSVAVIPN